MIIAVTLACTQCKTPLRARLYWPVDAEGVPLPDQLRRRLAQSGWTTTHRPVCPVCQAHNHNHHRPAGSEDPS